MEIIADFLPQNKFQVIQDFFIFPSTQAHCVYPFRTADGKGERRSVAFNASFSSKSINDKNEYLPKTQKSNR